MRHTLHIGNNLGVLPTMPDNSIDAIVTDPPYGLVFMGKDWDKDVPGPDTWRECLRVLKPGGHLLAFAGTRTQHKMATAIELAGFEVRDLIAWVYGSGFPKSHNISKALDKSEGHWRGRAGKVVSLNRAMSGPHYERTQLGSPITASAKQWDGWGTALKPAMEPITVARKPLEGTVAANVLKHGTGAINIDACRVGTDGGTCRHGKADKPNDAGWENMRGHGIATLALGRWPANLIHDGSEEPVSMLGDAARFFYCPKANKKDRDEGCEELPTQEKPAHMRTGNGTGETSMADGFQPTQRKNTHPTVKPTDLMRYLCRLVTPPGGTVLDPFTGSGSTGKAAILEGFNFIGIELSPEYAAIAEARIRAAYKPD